MNYNYLKYIIFKTLLKMEITDDMILEEEIDENYEPSKYEINDYA